MVVQGHLAVGNLTGYNWSVEVYKTQSGLEDSFHSFISVYKFKQDIV